ncbi:MAG: hypothetical protein ACON4Z_06525, partial [Planctomycetota bacterium]
ASVEVRRLPVPARVGGNFGVTALGARPAASGRGDTVDVLVEVRGVGSADPAGPTPEVSLDDAPLAVTPTAESLADGRRLRYLDVPATGQLLRVSLPGRDALDLDDVAAFRLPDRQPIPVAVQPGCPAVVRQAINADPGLVVAADVAGARVAVRAAGADDFGAGLPALELSEPSTAEDAFLVFHPEDQDPDAVLADLYTGLGLQEIDAMAAAAALGRSLTMGAKPAPRRALWVWRDLLSADFDFVRSRSFPLFVGLGVRWLAGVEDGPVRVAVGEPVTTRDAEVVAAGVRGRSFGASFEPRAPGALVLPDGVGLHAALLDPVASGAPLPDALEVPPLSAGSSSGVDLVTVLLVLALLLLAAEWVLFRTSRIP